MLSEKTLDLKEVWSILKNIKFIDKTIVDVFIVILIHDEEILKYNKIIMNLAAENYWNFLDNESLSSWKGFKIQERQEQMNDLVKGWLITELQISNLKGLTFTESDIINNSWDIKFLVELVNNHVIDQKILKNIVRNNKQDINSIKEELRWIISVNSLTMEQQVLTMNILNIWE